MIYQVEGVLKLIDFGLAKKLTDGEETLRPACQSSSLYWVWEIRIPCTASAAESEHSAKCFVLYRFPTTVPGTLKYACPENFRKYDQDGER